MTGAPIPLCSRRTFKGTVALADALGVAVAQLSVGPSGLKVDRFVDVGDAELPPEYASADPAAVAAALDGVLTEHKLPKRLLCLGLDDSLAGASLADLPDVKGRALNALVASHVRSELPVQNASVLADLVRVSGTDEQDAQRSWITWADESLVLGVRKALDARGIKVERVLPPSVALLDMFGRVRPSEDDKLELVVRFCWPSVVIGVFSGGVPQYVRFLGNLLVDAVGEPVDAGILELQRTVAYIRERNRGRAPEVVWHTGLDPSRAHDFEQRLEVALGIPAASLVLEAHGATDQGRVDRLTVLAAMLHHGTDRGRKRGQTLDLLPDPPARDHWVLAGLGAGVLAAAGFCFTVFDEVRQGNLGVGARRAALLAEHSRLSDSEPERSLLRTELELRHAWDASLAVVSSAGRDPVQPALEAVLALPPKVELASLSLSTPYDHAGLLSLSLTGDSTGSLAEDLNHYLTLLGERPWADRLITRRGDLAFAQESQAALEEMGVDVSLR